MNPTEELVHFYETDCPEELRLCADSFQHLELETAQKYMRKYLNTPCRLLDSCAGTGVYAFWLASLGHNVTAGDIVGINIEKIKADNASARLQEIYQGDADDLSRFADESFDAVLCMGALYHMKTQGERAKAISESMRVLRRGGLLFATYMNRYGVLLNNLDADMDNLGYVLNFAKTGDEGVFYASAPSEAEKLLTDAGLNVLSHIALDGPALFLTQTSKILNGNGFEKWKEYHFLVCEEPSLLGMSYHNMLIAEKTAPDHFVV